jgi:hypothetical protein
VPVGQGAKVQRMRSDQKTALYCSLSLRSWTLSMVEGERAGVRGNYERLLLLIKRLLRLPLTLTLSPSTMLRVQDRRERGPEGARQAKVQKVIQFAPASGFHRAAL